MITLMKYLKNQQRNQQFTLVCNIKESTMDIDKVSEIESSITLVCNIKESTMDIDSV